MLQCLHLRTKGIRVQERKRHTLQGKTTVRHASRFSSWLNWCRLWVSILADTRSARNFINETFFYQDCLLSPRHKKSVGCKSCNATDIYSIYGNLQFFEQQSDKSFSAISTALIKHCRSTLSLVETCLFWINVLLTMRNIYERNYSLKLAYAVPVSSIAKIRKVDL